MARIPKIGSLIILVATCLLCGCKDMVAPPSPELRSELKTIGLLRADLSPVAMPARPVEGAGTAAAVGAGQGAVGTLAALTQGGCSGGGFACALGLVAGVALAPVGAMIGAGVGASKSHSAEEVAAAYDAIASVISQTNPNEGLAAAFATSASETYGVEIKPVILAPLSEQYSLTQEAKPKYAVRLGYDQFAFQTNGRIDPDISLKATAFAEIILLEEQKPVYRRSWGYLSDSETYFVLAAADATLLRALIDASQKKIAATIARDLFAESEPSPIGQPRAGTVWTEAGPLATRPQGTATMPY